MGVEDGEDFGEAILLFNPPSDLGEEDSGEEHCRGEVGRKVACFTRGD